MCCWRFHGGNKSCAAGGSPIQHLKGKAFFNSIVIAQFCLLWTLSRGQILCVCSLRRWRHHSCTSRLLSFDSEALHQPLQVSMEVFGKCLSCRSVTCHTHVCVIPKQCFSLNLQWEACSTLRACSHLNQAQAVCVRCILLVYTGLVYIRSHSDQAHFIYE